MRFGPCPAYREKRLFPALYRLLDAAVFLEVPEAMFEVVESRLDEVVKEHVPSLEDLEAAYYESDFPVGHAVRSDTLEAWAAAYVDGRTVLDNDVEHLFDDNLKLQQDLNNAIDRLRESEEDKVEDTAAGVEEMKVQDAEGHTGSSSEAKIDD